MKKVTRIPYGKADFEAINAQGRYYIDKTMFIPEIEKNDYIFLIRPRRFGKSLFLSMLHSYYDINKSDRFDEFFRDTWIQKNPTEEKNIYMVLTFNFSVIDSGQGKLLDSFKSYCNLRIDKFLETYQRFFTESIIKNIKEEEEPYKKLIRLSTELAGLEQKIFIMIDEYDNFANTILSEYRVEEYQNLTHSDGYLRNFFSVLKDATDDSGASLARMFITGVSPITMDDVTSGMNIGKNISHYPKMNEAFGFTQQDVEDTLDYFIDEGSFNPDDKELSLRIMKDYYDSFRFCEEANKSMYNSCSILHFMTEYFAFGKIPKKIIDDNLKIDYKKLNSLVVLNKKLNGNFSVLEEVLEKGEISSAISNSFPYKELTKKKNFISLLFHFGLLTYTGKTKKGEPCLKIPNETIKTMMYGYLRSSLEEVGDYEVDIEKLRSYIGDMAYDGDFKPFFEFLAYHLEEQTCIRDYMAGEKVIQGFYLAYLNIADYYISCSEEELNKGYADILMKPFWMKYHDIEYGYVCEFKYIKRISDYNIEKDDKVELLNAKVAEKIYDSETQLAKYADDKNLDKIMNASTFGEIKIKRIVIVFHGWELVYLEEYL